MDLTEVTGPNAADQCEGVDEPALRLGELRESDECRFPALHGNLDFLQW